MTQTSLCTSTKLPSSKALGVDGSGVDVGEHLELIGTAHVVAVAGRAVGDQAIAVLPSARTWPASKGSIMPCSSAMRRIHLSDFMLMQCVQSSEILISGNWLHHRIVAASGQLPRHSFSGGISR